MQTIGERLLDARQRRGVSIREAAEATKVRGDYLAAMEANQFESIPLAEVYRRGFLKIYAKFLRLDSERIVGDFNALLAARNPVAPRGRRGEFPEPARSIEPREPEGMDEFSSGAIETAARPDDRRRMVIIGGGVLVFIVILFIGFKGCSSSDQKDPTGGAGAAAVSDSEGEVVFKSNANTPVSVSVFRAPAIKGGPNGAEVFREVIPANGRVVMRNHGNFVVFAPASVTFTINGEKTWAVPSGYASAPVTVPPKGR